MFETTSQNWMRYQSQYAVWVIFERVTVILGYFCHNFGNVQIIETFLDPFAAQDVRFPLVCFRIYKMTCHS